MTAVTDLFALQESDLALDRARARLQAIQETNLETQGELEWEVDEVRSKASEMEAKLYGGTVRNAKELSDLDTDVKSLKGQAAKREDVLLALMEEVEAADVEFRAAETEYSQIERAWQSNRAALLGEKPELKPEVERLETQRGQQVAEIGRASLGLYELLRE